MVLPQSLLQEIIDHVRHATQYGGTERRESRRFPLSAVVHIGQVRQQTVEIAEPAVLQDLSSTGIGVIAQRALNLGDEFGIVLPRGQGEPVAILCVVTRVYKMGESLVVVGADFREMLGPQS